MSGDPTGRGRGATRTVSIDVEHVTRVEGHGRIRVNATEGVVEEVTLSIVEANRFFEAISRGLLPHEAPWVIGRICGICCVGHQLAATKAVEDALGLSVSPQTVRLRRLLNLSQFLQSHVLHVYFLAVPDYLGAPSVLPLAKSHPDVVRRALRLKKLANDFTALFGGRTLHPMANTLRGFRTLPRPADVEALRARVVAALPDLEETVKIAASLEVPAFERETEYVALTHPDHYALYDGVVTSSDTGERLPASRYREITNEYTVPRSTAKWARWHRPSYAVGALARVNLNFAQLLPPAQEAAAVLGLKVPCVNPFANNLAQVVEIVHCAHMSVALLDEILEGGLVEEDLAYTPGPGRGVGAVEVPRGLLFHELGFDADGRCNHADAVIPTGQNLGNIEADMHAGSVKFFVSGRKGT